jgi:hypothetical protein
MVGEESGVFVEPLRLAIFERLRYGSVGLPSALLELAAECHFLRQRMFERILRGGIEGLFINELSALESRQC